MASGKYGPYRSCYRFDLTTISANPTVTQVRFKLNVTTAGEATGVWDVHAYNTNGQTDPSPDSNATQYARDISGNLYNNDDTTWRSISNTWIVLGGAANTDVQDAKAAGTVYAVSIHEEGDNDDTPIADGATTKPQLEITYTSGATYTKTYTADGHLLKRQTKTATVDARLLKTLTKTFITDAYTTLRFTKTLTADARLLKRQLKTFTSDGHLLKRQPKQFTSDAVLLKHIIKTFTTDAILEAAGFKGIDTDALLLKRMAKTFSADAYLIEAQLKGFLIDGLLLKRQITSVSVDAFLEVAFTTATKGIIVDAILLKHQTATFTCDACLAGPTPFTGVSGGISHRYKNPCILVTADGHLLLNINMNKPQYIEID